MYLLHTFYFVFTTIKISVLKLFLIYNYLIFNFYNNVRTKKIVIKKKQQKNMNQTKVFKNLFG